MKMVCVPALHSESQNFAFPLFILFSDGQQSIINLVLDAGPAAQVQVQKLISI